MWTVSKVKKSSATEIFTLRSDDEFKALLTVHQDISV